MHVPETNAAMVSSCLILDEYLRFLDKGQGQETHSSSILVVGVTIALTEVRWDREAFLKRGGIYDWSKDTGFGGTCGSEPPKDLQF